MSLCFCAVCTYANELSSLGKPGRTFVLYLCLTLTVLWETYVFTILKYLFLSPVCSVIASYLLRWVLALIAH